MVRTRSKMATSSSFGNVPPSPMDIKVSGFKGFAPIPESLKEVTKDSDVMDVDAPCTLTPESLALLCSKNKVSENLLIRLPEGEEQIDWYSENWGTICVDYFPLRKIIPLPKLILDFCLSFDLAPSQLMPSLWLIVLSVEALCEKFGLEFNFGDLMKCYNIQRKGSGLYTLHARNRLEPLIAAPADLEKQWRGRFVFVHKSVLAGSDVNLRTKWVNQGKLFPY